MKIDHRRITVTREYRGLTVDELSERSGVSVQTILEIEAGEYPDMPFSVAYRLCRVLAVNLESLFIPVIDPERDTLQDKLIRRIEILPAWAQSEVVTEVIMFEKRWLPDIHDLRQYGNRDHVDQDEPEYGNDVPCGERK